MFEKHKDYTLSLFFFSLAFIIRFLLISKGPFHMDTLELSINAQKTLDTLNIHYQHGLGCPLTVISASIFILLTRLFGVSDPVLSVNLMSVVFGSLAVAIFYLFSRKIMDTAGAVASSLIFTFLPLNISLSTFGMTHPLSVFFNLTGIYFLFLYLEEYRLRKLILSAVFLGLAATTRLTDGLIVIAAIFLCMMETTNKSKISKKNMIYRLAMFLTSYSIIVLFFYLPMLFENGLFRFREAASVYYFDHSLANFYIASSWMVEILSLPGTIVFIAGMGYFFLEKSRILFYFLMIWFISLFVYYGSYSCVDERYLLLGTIPFLIMQGYFISRGFKLKRLRVVSIFLIFIIIAHNFIEFYPVIRLRHKYNLQKDFAGFLQRNTKPSSCIIAVDEGPFIEYYTKRKILYKVIGLNKQEFNKFFRELNLLMAKGIDIYIVSSCIYSYDPKRYFEKTLFNDYRLEYIGGHIYEDWNRTTIRRGIFMQKLYKIGKKKG